MTLSESFAAVARQMEKFDRTQKGLMEWAHQLDAYLMVAREKRGEDGQAVDA